MNLCGVLLVSSQYILSKYQLFRIFKNSQLNLFDFKVCIEIYKKGEWKEHLKTEGVQPKTLISTLFFCIINFFMISEQIVFSGDLYLGPHRFFVSKTQKKNIFKNQNKQKNHDIHSKKFQLLQKVKQRTNTWSTIPDKLNSKNYTTWCTQM